jgi:hypothetical protein
MEWLVYPILVCGLVSESVLMIKERSVGRFLMVVAFGAALGYVWRIS